MIRAPLLAALLTCSLIACRKERRVEEGPPAPADVPDFPSDVHVDARDAKGSVTYRYGAANMDSRSDSITVVLGADPISCNTLGTNSYWGRPNHMTVHVSPGPQNGYYAGRTIGTPVQLVVSMNRDDPSFADNLHGLVTLDQQTSATMVSGTLTVDEPEKKKSAKGRFQVTVCPPRERLRRATPLPAPGRAGPLEIDASGHPGITLSRATVTVTRGSDPALAKLLLTFDLPPGSPPSRGALDLEGVPLGAVRQSERALMLEPQPMRFWMKRTGDTGKPSESMEWPPRHVWGVGDAYGWVRFIKPAFGAGERFEAEIAIEEEGFHARGIVSGVASR